MRIIPKFQENPLTIFIVLNVVPRMGIEPTRPKGHMALNHACLPVPAPRFLKCQ